MSTQRGDRFLVYKCSCGTGSWCIKEIVICPNCGRKNKAYIPEDDPYWAEVKNKNKGA